MNSRLVCTALTISAIACAANSSVSQAAAKLEQQAAKTPASLAMEFRLRGAQALQARYPELARQFLDATLAGLAGDATPNFVVLQALAEVAPSEAMTLASKWGQAGNQMAISYLMRFDHADQARALYKQTVAALPDPLTPAAAMWLINASAPLHKALPEGVAESYERVLRAASAAEYASDMKPQITGTIQMGQTSIATDNTRDTLLILAGARLRLVSPERYEKYQDLLAKWKIGGTVIFRPTNTASAPTPEVMAISKRMGTMRGLPTDADRSALVKTLVPEIAALPPQQKLGLIRSMASVSTEGDLGKDALGMVAVTLAGALRESAKLPGSYGDSYIELAKLVRYERLEVPSSPGLDAAQAVLELRERVQQENGFTLTSLDGKTYTLDGLRGKIVLLNFWATWCPPCRKEMPDMEKLYRTYEKKGLTVIAVSDEDRETVANFMAKNNYTFPIALDPGRKVNLAFSVEGIPKSFIFDREGRLAAQAIDMRTEAQFMELLKLAGLEE
jgi:peroxiredoxin